MLSNYEYYAYCFLVKRLVILGDWQKIVFSYVLLQEDDDDGMAEEKEIRDVDDDDDDDEKTDIDGDDQSTGRYCDFSGVCAWRMSYS